MYYIKDTKITNNVATVCKHKKYFDKNKSFLGIFLSYKANAVMVHPKNKSDNYMYYNYITTPIEAEYLCILL